MRFDSSALSRAAHGRACNEKSDASVGVVPDRGRQRNERVGEGSRSLWPYLKRDRDSRETRDGPEPAPVPPPPVHER
jgi:hypothetical protein